MSYMFTQATQFNQFLDFWTVSSVTSTRGMFWGASSFDQKIESWDASSVTSMENMFRSASSFNSPLESWDTSKVTSMKYMFGEELGRVDFSDQPVDEWFAAPGAALNFRGAVRFNQPLGNWNVASVKDMYGMFSRAASFNQDLCSWGKVLGAEVLVDQMFNATACPRDVAPNMAASSRGPFCHVC